MNKELWQVFYSETEEIIQGMEADLLSLEKNPDDKNRINAVFRAAHTLKGNAATIGGLDRVVGFAHAMENALDMLRKDRLALTDQLTSLFLEAVDDLKSTLTLILAGRPVNEKKLGEIESAFAALEPGGLGAAIAQPPRTHLQVEPRSAPTGLVRKNRDRLIFIIPELPPFPAKSIGVDRSEIDKVLFADYRIFGLRLSDSFDLKTKNKDIGGQLREIEPFAEILARDTIVEEGEELHFILVATMLEKPDILGVGIGLPAERITSYSSELIRNVTVEQSTATMPDTEAARIHLSEYTSAPDWMMESIRVNIDLIDRLLGLAGELVIGRNQLNRILQPAESEVKGLSHLLQHVDLVTTDMQEHTMQMRMQPLGNILDRFPKVVNGLAAALGKEVEIEIIGSEVELDKSVLQVLSDPMTHLIRNCLDHGIEPPDLRKRRDKPVKGYILIKAYQDEGRVNITISDDGGGIDPDILADKAVKLGMLEQNRARLMNDREKLNLIFKPGFSTAETITDVSGRGVGMDVVRTNIERIGGSLEIDSIPGRGTTIQLRLPLTLAIIPCLLVKSGGRPYAVPQRDVVEIVYITREDFSSKIEIVGDAAVMRRRGKLLPLVRLKDLLAGQTPSGGLISGVKDSSQLFKDAINGQLFVVVIRLGQNRYGLLVDEPMDTEEVVVKPLSDHIKHCRFFSGTTILGDGSVAMILSAGGMASDFGLSFKDKSDGSETGGASHSKKKSGRHSESVIWFNYEEDEFFALAVGETARLEMIFPGALQKSGNREFIPYRGGNLRIIRLDEYLPVSRPRQLPEELYVIIPKAADWRSGILATRVIDTIDTGAAIVPDGFSKPGIRGSTIIGGKLTLFIDPVELCNLTENPDTLPEAEYYENQSPM